MLKLICKVHLLPVFWVVSLGKGSKSRKQTLECHVSRKGRATLRLPSSERPAWRADLSGVWKFGSQILSTTFPRGPPYSEELINLICPMCSLLTSWFSAGFCNCGKKPGYVMCLSDSGALSHCQANQVINISCMQAAGKLNPRLSDFTRKGWMTPMVLHECCICFVPPWSIQRCEDN